jgi:D-3-phosphoglycerate dehydrogenase
LKIAILDDYQNAVKDLRCFSLLNSFDVSIFTDTPASINELAVRLQPFDTLVLIRERTTINEALLAQLPNLKVISQTGKISNHIDVTACEKYGVTILEGTGSATAPAELCWALIMAASRQIVPYANALQNNQWQQSGLGLGRTLSGLTLGIWGYGCIGQMVAKYAKTFDMNVLVWGSLSSREKAVTDGFQAASTKEVFFSQSDILSLHVRLNDSTKGIVSFADLAHMKTDALLVNISRAELIEPTALEKSLQTGHPGFAAIDVFESEPVNASDNPLLQMPNVLCTPHIGYVEKNSYELYFRAAFENIVNYSRA